MADGLWYQEQAGERIQDVKATLLLREEGLTEAQKQLAALQAQFAASEAHSEAVQRDHEAQKAHAQSEHQREADGWVASNEQMEAARSALQVASDRLAAQQEAAEQAHTRAMSELRQQHQVELQAVQAQQSAAAEAVQKAHQQERTDAAEQMAALKQQLEESIAELNVQMVEQQLNAGISTSSL